ncbi:MAG: hypothetical protein PVH37_17575 [Desulfobacterales bacterium]|jgi:hypothetical protein
MKQETLVMQVPDQILDDGSSIQAVHLDSGYRIDSGTGPARMTFAQVFNRQSNNT